MSSDGPKAVISYITKIILFLPVSVPSAVVADHVTGSLDPDWSNVGKTQFYVRGLPRYVISGFSASWKGVGSATNKQRSRSTPGGLQFHLFRFQIVVDESKPPTLARVLATGQKQTIVDRLASR